MGFGEKVLKSKELGTMVEFLTIQSSEQTEEEVRYKNINRKQIRFDLGDLSTMLKIGKIIKPYGLKQYLVNVLSRSRFSFLRIMAEERLAKRGVGFLRSFYLKYPEKFASVDLSSNKKTRMLIIRGIMIISEQVNQKTISLKDDKDNFLSELESFRSKFKEEEAKLRRQEALIKELTLEDEGKDLIGVEA